MRVSTNFPSFWEKHMQTKEKIPQLSVWKVGKNVRLRDYPKVTAGQMQLTEGALYPTLHKLEAEGLLIQVVDGRTCKYYSVTKK